MTSTAPAPVTAGAADSPTAEVAAPAVVQPAPERHLRRVRADRGAVLGAHERRAAGAAEHLQHRRAELLHPDPRHRDDPDHHRRAHRPVGGLGGGRHRGDLGRADGEPGRAVAAGGARDHRRGRVDRRVPGLLDRLLRHPGVHRHAGGDARVPRGHAHRAGQPGHRPVPRRRPHAVQRLRRGLPRQRRPRPAGRRRHHHPAGRVGGGGGDRAHAVAHPHGPAVLRPGRRPVPAVRGEDRGAVPS